jgi:hypothetical protein
MKTALAFWRGTTAPAAIRATYERPGAINWTRISLLFALGIVLAGNLATPLIATAQNLGTSPQFGQAVQGQQATTVEGTVLNIVNWGCNVIAPVIAIACLGVAGWHFKSGRGYLGWGVIRNASTTQYERSPARSHVWVASTRTLPCRPRFLSFEA